MYLSCRAPTPGRYLQPSGFWGLSQTDSAGTAAAAAAAAASSAAAAAAAAFSRATGYDAPGFYGSSPSGGTLASAGSLTSGSSGSGSGGGNPSEPGRSSKGHDFKAAWDLLQRSLACFLKDKAAKNAMQLPAAWNPLAWLVVYCAVVKRDMRQDGKLVALSTQANAAAAAAAGAGSSRAMLPAGAAGSDADAASLVGDGSLGSMVVGVAGGLGTPAAAADMPGGLLTLVHPPTHPCSAAAA